MNWKNKQTIVYGVLAAAICAFLYLLVSASYEAPERLISPAEYKKKLKITDSSSETTYVPPPVPQLEIEKSYPDYGKKDIFTTIMPTPSPEPTRTPRPTPTPSLERVMKNYEMQGVVGSKIFMLNKRTKEELMMDVGQKFQDEDRNQKMDIEIISVDPATFTAKFRYQDQEYELKMSF
ncbi:MAG: hypothetical protein Kow0059_09580 [Candidatus Sumerlaeia bacterium]